MNIGDPQDLERQFAALHAALGGVVEEEPPGLLLRVAHPVLAGSAANYAVLLTPEGLPHAPAAAAWLAGRGRLPALLVPSGWHGAAYGPRMLQAVGLRSRGRLYALCASPPGRGAAPGPDPEAGGALRIHRLPLTMMANWVDLMLAAFAVPAPLRISARTAWSGLPERLAPGQQLQLYIAEWAGQAVGTGGLLHLPGGGAVLAGGAVRRGFRRRGVGRALLRRRLADAFAAGAATAACQTRHPAVLRNWQVLGGSVAYRARIWT